MKVTKADLFWNYGATFMRVASALIILPLILRMLPSEEVGLWTVMIGLNSMIYLLDFGFFQTFSRAVTYIFSGAQKLEKKGFVPVPLNTDLNYSLLKGLLKAMQRFYGFVALLLLALLFSAGIWYIGELLSDFGGNVQDAKIAWFSYGILLCYQFFTYYYDAALVGRGMIKRSRQIIVFSQSLHVIVSATLLSLGFGIISMVIGQTTATIVNRYLARRAFYDNLTKQKLSVVSSVGWKELLATLFHTAYKNGLASLSWVFTNRMLAVFGALYIPLTQMASYGITKQVADITITLSLAWFFTYYPKLTGEQVRNQTSQVKRIYIKSSIIAVAVFIAAAITVFIAGDFVLAKIGSSTWLLPDNLMLLLFAASMMEALTQLATSVLMSRNEVPHYISQSLTALFATLGLFIALKYSKTGVLTLIAVPMLAQFAYQHWRWRLKLAKELHIIPQDYLDGLKSIYKSIPIFDNNKN